MNPRIQWMMLLTMAAMLMSCQSQQPVAKPASERDIVEAQREYIEYRASHAGVKLPPRVEPVASTPEAQQPQQVAVAPTPATPAVRPTTPTPAQAPAPAQPAPTRKPTPVATVETPRLEASDTEVKVLVARPVETQTQAPAPAPAVAKPEPAQASAQPSPSPIINPIPTPTAKPAAAKPAATKPAAVKPAPAKPAPAKTTATAASARIPLGASDGFDSAGGVVSSSIRPAAARPGSIARQPAIKVGAAGQTGPIAELIQAAGTQKAMAVLAAPEGHNLASIAEALRNVSMRLTGDNAATVKKLATSGSTPAVRMLAIDALLRSEWPGRDSFAAELLTSQSESAATRGTMAERVIGAGVKAQFPQAVAILTQDRTGAGLFAARRAIVHAGPAIIAPLVNHVVRNRNDDSAVIARRLFRWVESTAGPDEAFDDSFGKNSSEMLVVMFRERFGAAGLPQLRKAQASADAGMQSVIAQAIADIEGGRSMATVPADFAKVFTIAYTTDQTTVRVLTDRALWADQGPDQTMKWSDSTSSVVQRVTPLPRTQVESMRTWTDEWKTGLKIGDEGVDFVDLW